MVLFAVQHPGLVAAIFAFFFVAQMVVVKFVAIAIAFVLKYVLGLIAGGVVTWYLQKMFMIHIWPRLTQDHRRDLLKLKDRILLAPKNQTSTRDDE